jgi:hypothetical protein
VPLAGPPVAATPSALAGEEVFFVRKEAAFRHPAMPPVDAGMSDRDHDLGEAKAVQKILTRNPATRN